MHDQEISQSDTVDKNTVSRKSCTYTCTQQEDSESEATNTLFPIKIIAKLEGILNSALQNKGQTLISHKQ